VKVPVVPGYEVLDFIGRGRSAEVYRARSEDSGEIVAIKVSHPSPRHGADELAFKLEYHLHSRLGEHPNIVRALDFGELDETRRFYTMEFVDTLRLDELFRSGGVDALGEVALAVTSALEFSHAQGILHSDIKPANLLVSRNGNGPEERTMLADFGHAHHLGQASGSIHGSFAYLAPETLTLPQPDARSDLYSLGVTLFEAIAGRLPYSASNMRELFLAHTEHRAPSVADFAADLPAPWVELIDSLISRNRELRPPSATEASERIAGLLGRERQGPATRTETLPRFAPLLAHVGRTAALERILGTLRAPGGPRTIVITGEEGVGKTRLVEEVALRLELEGGSVHRSDAREGTSAGFRILRRVRQEGELVDLASRDADGATSTAEPTRGSARQADLERLVDRFLPVERIHEERIFLFDSLEDADLDSRSFLRTLHDRLGGSKSLLLLAGRDDDPDGFVEAFRRAGAEVIALEPLDDAERMRFLRAHLGEAAGTPDAVGLDDGSLERLVSWMGRHAGGNPRRMEASLRTLAQAGALARVDGRWTLREDELRNVRPPTSTEEQAVEGARDLPDALRPHLDAACVAGPEFDASALAALSSDPDGVTRFLAESTRRGLIARRAGTPSEYRFVSPETHRALYASLDELVRRTLHGSIAKTIEGGSPETVRWEEVARHRERAGHREPARDASVRAANRLRTEGACAEAARLYARAWELHTEAERAALPAFAPDWIATLSSNGQVEDSLARARDVLAAASDVGDEHPGRGRVRLGAAYAELDLGRRREARELLEPLLATDTPGAPALVAQAQVAASEIDLADGDLDSARVRLHGARDIGQRLDDLRLVGRAENRLGVLSWREGDELSCVDWQERAQKHFADSKSEDLLPAVWAMQATCFFDLVQLRKAATFHRRAVEGYQRRHVRAEAARSYQNLATSLIELGHLSEADRALASAERLRGRSAGPRTLSFYERVRAQLAMVRGQLETASTHIDRALDLARETGDDYVVMSHLTVRADIELEAGRPERSAETAERSLRLAREARDRWGVAESLRLLGHAAKDRGDASRARDVLDEALAGDGREINRHIRFRIQLLRAELLATHAPEEADSALAECRALADLSDSPLWKGRLLRTEGALHAARGEHDVASQSISAAYELFADLGSEIHRARCLVARATSHWALGNRNAARTAWRHAVPLYRSLGVAVPEPPFPELEPADEDGDDRGSLRAVQRILEAAASVSRDITTLQSVDEVLARILDVAITYLGTERGVVALADAETGELGVRFARNIDHESIADGLEISRTALLSVGADGEMVHTGDALADPRLSLHESVRKSRIRSLIALPIRFGDRVLGALYMDHRVLTDLFGPEERLFLRFIADMAAIGIHNARRFEMAEDQVRSLRSELEEEEHSFPRTIVGAGPRMRETVERGVRAARRLEVILLTGETGVGKDHFARIFHQASRLAGPFVNVELPNLGEGLAESELFGVARGVATGVESRPGLLEQAHGGTVFLNEIGDLPLPLQPMLLRFLDTGLFRRVGATTENHFEGLVICATNADLPRRMEEGAFRSDLFYRFDCRLEIPPLRERTEDIPSLVEMFLGAMEHRPGGRRYVMDPEAMRVLTLCPWHGNVRELKRCIESAAADSPDGVLRRDQLNALSLEQLSPDAAAEAAGVRDELDAHEIRRIKEAMLRHGGIIARAAEALDLHEAALRRRLQRYGLKHLATRARRPGSADETVG
jgi:Nif-specific regulatory protein